MTLKERAYNYALMECRKNGTKDDLSRIYNAYNDGYIDSGPKTAKWVYFLLGILVGITLKFLL